MKSAVELITTGNELLNGRTLNRHLQVVGAQLTDRGFTLTQHLTVPDDISKIRDAVRDALGRVELVLISGGLGPTSDDVTREAIAEFLGRGVVEDRGALGALEKRAARVGRKLSDAARRQAQVIEHAKVLSNRMGAAPGQQIDVEGKTLFVLPGPPSEFNAVLEDHVLPWLEAHRSVEESYQRRFYVCRLGESDLVSRLDALSFPPPHVEVAYCAAPARVEIRLTSDQDHKESLFSAARLVRKALFPYIYSEKVSDLASVVGALLIEKQFTVATAESCTGGLLGYALTSPSGSSSYYLGGIVSYSNSSKVREVGVSQDTLDLHGAVSEPVAKEMSMGVLRRFRSTYGVAVTGIAGPTGGTDDKPVGLVYLSVSDEKLTVVKRFQFPGTRSVVREWSSRTALDLLRCRVLGLSEQGHGKR